jgi:hypothetical protein
LLADLVVKVKAVAAVVAVKTKNAPCPAAVAAKMTRLAKKATRVALKTVRRQIANKPLLTIAVAINN